jgi:hypothetical protein
MGRIFFIAAGQTVVAISIAFNFFLYPVSFAVISTEGRDLKRFLTPPRAGIRNDTSAT